MFKKKENVYFTLLKEQMYKVKTAEEAFYDLITHYERVEDKIANMKVLETECDMQSHKLMRELNKSKRTPIKREDIYSLTREIDDIVDALEETANRFGVFNVQSVRHEVLTMADIIKQEVDELVGMFENLYDKSKKDIIMKQKIEVNRLENDGDIIYRKSLTTLFREEKDPIEIIKWKHIFEQLEKAMDSCENVANMTEGVLMKYA